MIEAPKLFRTEVPLRGVNAFTPSFLTPLGCIDLQLEANAALRPPIAAFVAGEQTLLIWPADLGVELLLTRPVLSLPPGMAVDGACAAVWRFPRSSNRDSLIIRCVWTGTPSWSDVGPESGENLDAQTWTDGHTKVTVGLPDFGLATTYLRDGFKIMVGQLPEIHFVCAWARDVVDDVSTWFAVDCTPAQLFPK